MAFVHKNPTLSFLCAKGPRLSTFVKAQALMIRYMTDLIQFDPWLAALPPTSIGYGAPHEAHNLGMISLASHECCIAPLNLRIPR